MTICPECEIPMIHTIQYCGDFWKCDCCGSCPESHCSNHLTGPDEDEEKEVEITLDATYQSL